MSISSEISRISGNITDSLAAVAAKGVTVPSGSNSDDLPELIAQISTTSNSAAVTIVDTQDSAGGTIRKIIGVNIGDTTATAADVAAGKYFYTAAGVKTAGTATGGGSGSGGSVYQDANGYIVLSPSGTPFAAEKDVNFIDYDGTILYSYTAQEAQALTALPANPTHTGLTSQGWNWALADIKSQLTNVGGKVWVGQNYITTSGDTEIDFTLEAGYLSPYLQISPSGTVTIDWGDNSATETATGSNSNIWVQHTYASPGSYTLKRTPVDNATFGFYVSSDSYSSVFSIKNSAEKAVTYSRTITAIRIGTGFLIKNCSFSRLYNLKTITMPSGTAFINSSTFTYCFSLLSFTIPSGATTVPSSAFNYSYNIKNVSIPKSVTSISSSAFTTCFSIKELTIPYGVTSIKSSAFSFCYGMKYLAIPSTVTEFANYAFQNCYNITNLTIPSGTTKIYSSMISYCHSLKTFNIPNTVTEIQSSAFSNCQGIVSITIPSSVTTIGNNAFQYMNSLTSLTIPSSVTSIGNYVFSNCSQMDEYHFQRETPPTIGTTIFNGIKSDCIIYVPYSADHSVLSNYKTASNWSEYADYIQEEPQ